MIVSMMSHLIDDLKKHAQAYETGEDEGAVTAISTAKILREAAWTIEEQGLKIHANNLFGGWIPVEQGLPEDNQKVLMWLEWDTPHSDEGTRHSYGIGIYQGDGHWPCEYIHPAARCLAWAFLPEPYEKKEEGEQE